MKIFYPTPLFNRLQVVRFDTFCLQMIGLDRATIQFHYSLSQLWSAITRLIRTALIVGSLVSVRKLPTIATYYKFSYSALACLKITMSR